jgi:hypothetical protein
VSSAHALTATAEASSYFWPAWSGLSSGASAVAMISPLVGARNQAGCSWRATSRGSRAGADGGERLRLREKLRAAEPEP